MQRLRAAARRGDADAMAELAAALLRSGAAGDAEMAARWYRRAAEGGSTVAVEWMCRAYCKGAPGVSVDPAESHRWAVRGAEAGSSWCQVIAGCALANGTDVAKDETAAVRWIRAAARAGNTLAQFSVYIRYRDGLGDLRADDPAGVAWLRKSAEGGHIDAQAELARCLRDRIGMPVDATEANTWGLRAAEGGDAWSQGDMGGRLLYGEGVPTDAVAGVALLRRAVDAGYTPACINLGDAHVGGLGGLPVDKAAARALYERAASCPYPELAAKARARLHSLTSSAHSYGKLDALPAEVPPVCGYAACGAALDAGSLSGLCAGCRAVRYCDSDCQLAAWPEHRAACKAAVAARAASPAAAPPAASPALPPNAPSAALMAQLDEIEMWRRMPLAALRAAAVSGTAAAQGAIGIAYLRGTQGLEED
jgi:hypothetical protein